MYTKTELKKIFAKYNFRPLKRLGENYLIDANIKNKIIDEAAVTKDDIVLEIGPGLGALTYTIAKSGAAIFAVEKDKKAFLILKELIGENFPNLKLFCGDILQFDVSTLLTINPEHSRRIDFKNILSSKKIKVVGNLPYYITTPVIERLIKERRSIKSILMVIQKEVANRLIAAPGTKDYSSISCLVGYHTKPAYIHTIKRTSFYPAPEVDSSLIRLDVLNEPSVKVKDEELFFKIVRGAFNQRRKSIINSLSRKEVLALPKEELSSILHAAKVDPAIRPECLSLSDFARISNAVKQQNFCNRH